MRNGKLMTVGFVFCFVLLLLFFFESGNSKKHFLNIYEPNLEIQIIEMQQKNKMNSVVCRAELVFLDFTEKSALK